MPTAVFSSLLAGICGVVEIHYNFDVDNLYWTEKWTLTSVGNSTKLHINAYFKANSVARNSLYNWVTCT
jgi:gamma-glutamylcysteine synthetase